MNKKSYLGKHELKYTINVGNIDNYSQTDCDIIQLQYHSIYLKLIMQENWYLL